MFNFIISNIITIITIWKYNRRLWKTRYFVCIQRQSKNKTAI